MGGLLQYYIFSSLRADLSAWQFIIRISLVKIPLQSFRKFTKIIIKYLFTSLKTIKYQTWTNQ